MFCICQRHTGPTVWTTLGETCLRAFYKAKFSYVGEKMQLCRSEQLLQMLILPVFSPHRARVPSSGNLTVMTPKPPPKHPWTAGLSLVSLHSYFVCGGRVKVSFKPFKTSFKAPHFLSVVPFHLLPVQLTDHVDGSLCSYPALTLLFPL